MIRKSIDSYLKSTKQKKRNAKFKGLYIRIGKELRQRQREPSHFTEALAALGMSIMTGPINGNKLIEYNTVEEFTAPSFLQDKCTKKYFGNKNKMSDIECLEQPEEAQSGKQLIYS